MQQQAPGSGGHEIDRLRIDPVAEPMGGEISGSSAKQEQDFFERGGREFQLKHNQQNLGWLGVVFGSSAAAYTNIAGFLIGACLIGVFLTFCFPSNPDMGEARKLLTGLITTAMGFIFGRASKG